MNAQRLEHCNILSFGETKLENSHFAVFDFPTLTSVGNEQSRELSFPNTKVQPRERIVLLVSWMCLLGILPPWVTGSGTRHPIYKDDKMFC